MQKLFTPFIIFVSFLVGWSLFQYTQESSDKIQKSFSLDEDWRNPAAIHKSHDLSRLSGAELLKAGKSHLLEDFVLEKKEDRVGIGMNHFVVKGVDGNKQFACEFYDKVELSFTGEGVAENGHLPSLRVETDCEMAGNIHRMKKIWIPFESIRKVPTNELSHFFFEKENIFVTVEHASYALPSTWTLNSIRVFNQIHSDRNLVIDSRSVRKSFSSLPQMKW